MYARPRSVSAVTLGPEKETLSHTAARSHTHTPLKLRTTKPSTYLFHGAVDRVARLVEAGGGLLALGHDFFVQVAPLQRPHPPRVSHSLEELDSRRVVQ